MTPWTAAYQASLPFTVSWSLLKLMSVESVIPSNHLILCRPLSSCLQSSPASGSFLMRALRIRWPNYWSFCFSISPSSEYSGLISFRIDWFDLLAAQGTLKSLLQHHCSLCIGIMSNIDQSHGCQPVLTVRTVKQILTSLLMVTVDPSGYFCFLESIMTRNTF